MFTITVTQDIRRPPEAVFAYAGDYANDPKWRQGVEDMVYDTEGPTRAGTRTREKMRSMGRLVETVAEVVAYSPSRTAFRSLTGPVPCEGHREFAAIPDGTRFTYSLTLKPTGILKRIDFLLRPMFEKQIRKDVQRLKDQLESAA